MWVYLKRCCFVCDQSTTQQKNYKNGSVCKFTLKVHILKTSEWKSFMFFTNGRQLGN